MRGPATSTPLLCLALLAPAALLPACGLRYGGSSQDKVLANLRGENATLREQVTNLEREREEWRVKALANAATFSALPIASPATDEAAQLAAQVAAALPAVVALEVDALSGPAPRDPSKFIVYVQPRDGRGRFTQAVGRLTVRVLSRPAADATNSPTDVELARADLAPVQLRDAYRSGFTGTNYAIELPVAAAITSDASTLLIRAELTDLLTGQTHRAERVRAVPR
jgi:hypothetical protein